MTDGAADSDRDGAVTDRAADADAKLPAIAPERPRRRIRWAVRRGRRAAGGRRAPPPPPPPPPPPAEGVDPLAERLATAERNAAAAVKPATAERRAGSKPGAERKAGASRARPGARVRRALFADGGEDLPTTRP